MYWLKRFFETKTKRRIRHLEYYKDQIDSRVDRLSDEIVLLRKIANCKETKKINYPSYCVFGAGGDAVREKEMSEKREAVRKEGFYFLHRYLDSKDEVWAKD